MKVKDIRTKTGLSQSRFAEKFGLPVRTLQQWEQEKSSPPEYVIAMLNKIQEIDDAEKFEVRRYHLPEAKRYKKCIPEKFKNITKIYPIQQRKVASLLKDIAKDKKVKKVIIFGSSVTPRCHVGSDVDVYVETDGQKAPNIGKKDFEYDLWTNHDVDARLLKEIKQKGVQVYG